MKSRQTEVSEGLKKIDCVFKKVYGDKSTTNICQSFEQNNIKTPTVETNYHSIRSELGETYTFHNHGFP